MKNLQALAGGAAPNEVGGILLGSKEMIYDFIIVPGEFSPKSVNMRFDELPIYVNAVGTFHSHPGGDVRPSAADRQVFSRSGRVHMILSGTEFGAYDSSGKKSEMVVA